MKPAKFDYLAPTTLDEATAMLASRGPEATVLAGGQSLVPAMNMRLARPAALIDLNAVAELSFVRETKDGLHIGAMTRQRALEHSPIIAARCPLLAAALPHIAHFQIRNRGTLGGSLAHNDPAAELPAIAAALDAVLTIARENEQRQVNWRQFFAGMLTTTLEADEILLSVHVPALPPGTGVGFAEVSRRHGDFALVGAAAVLHRAENGAIDIARLVLFGIGDGPVRSNEAEQCLISAVGDEAAWREAAERITRAIEPADDVHASAAYRRDVARVLAQQVLTQAWKQTHVGHA